MLGKKTRGRRRIELIDDLLEKKNYRDLKKAVEDRRVWRTIRRDCHKPALQADNSMMIKPKPPQLIDDLLDKPVGD